MERYVSLNLWSMRVIGVWYPDKSSSFEVKVSFFLRSLTVASFLFILIPAAIAVQDHLRRFSLSTVVEILALLISSTLILCKTVNIVMRRNEIRILLNGMSIFWQGAIKTNEVNSMTGFAKVGRNVTKCYFALGFFNLISFAGQPIIDSYIISGYKNSSAIVNRLPFDGWENFMAVYHPTSIIVLVYSCHLLAAIMGTVASIGHDCLFVVLILHVCANLRGITSSLRLLDDFNDLNQVEEHIVRCAKKFRDLIDYTKGLENMLSLYLLAQAISSTLIICLTSFLVSRDLQANKEFFKYVAFWAGALFQLFIFCWAANCLQTEANKVGRSAYEAYGKLMNLDFKNHERHRHLLTKTPGYLQMILLRSQTPPKITAGNFYALSLENYKNVLSTSYSYFTILRAFADNKT